MDVTFFLHKIIKHTWTKFTGEKALLKWPVWYDNLAFIQYLQIMFLRKMWTNMSALPGYINGNVSTYFVDQIRKHLNLKTSALKVNDISGNPLYFSNQTGFMCIFIFTVGAVYGDQNVWEHSWSLWIVYCCFV